MSLLTRHFSVYQLSVYEINNTLTHVGLCKYLHQEHKEKMITHKD